MLSWTISLSKRLGLNRVPNAIRKLSLKRATSADERALLFRAGLALLMILALRYMPHPNEAHPACEAGEFFRSNTAAWRRTWFICTEGYVTPIFTRPAESATATRCNAAGKSWTAHTPMDIKYTNHTLSATQFKRVHGHTEACMWAYIDNN